MQIRQILRVSDQGVSRPYQCLDERGDILKLDVRMFDDWRKCKGILAKGLA